MLKKQDLFCFIATLFLLVALQPVLAAYNVGDTAANFTLPIHESNSSISLYDYAGQIVVLDFFAYWCGPCATASSEMEPQIQQYYRNLGGNPVHIPVKVISISIDNSAPAQTDAYISNYGLETVLEDSYQVVYNAFGAGYIPQIAIINGAVGTNHKQWEVLYNQAGYSSGKYTSFRTIINSVTGSTGNLKVILWPIDAACNGGEWNLDGELWQTSGTTISNILAGTHTVNYKSIAGWTAPASEQVTITQNQTIQVNQTYNNVADINGDGQVDLQDYALLAKKWLFTGSCREDLGQNGVVDFRDLMIFAENWLVYNKNVADINGDGQVDLQDYILLAKKWRFIGSCREDLGQNGVVDFRDLMIFAGNWLVHR
jgi:peroxiredoxin